MSEEQFKTVDYWKKRFELLEDIVSGYVSAAVMKEIQRKAAGHAGGRAYPKKDSPDISDVHVEGLNEDISKPEVTEEYVRIPVAECKVTATIDIDRARGIKALYCGEEKKVRTYLFPSDKFTMAEAKEWISEHKSSKQDTYNCECLKCGHTMKSEEHCGDIKCPKCGGEMRRVERSGVGKGEKSYEVPIWKTDEEKKLVYGIVLEPNTVDSQGDIVSEEEIEKACHGFLKNSRIIFSEHKKKQSDVYVVENYIAPCDFDNVKKGSWIMTTFVNDNDIWEQVKKGEFTGYSIRGYANRE